MIYWNCIYQYFKWSNYVIQKQTQKKPNQKTHNRTEWKNSCCPSEKVTVSTDRDLMTFDKLCPTQKILPLTKLNQVLPVGEVKSPFDLF